LFLPGCQRAAIAETIPADENTVELILASLSDETDEPQAGNTTQSRQFALIPERGQPGEPVTVGLSDPGWKQGAGPRNLQAVLLDSRGRRLTKAAFFSLAGEAEEQELRAAILAIPSTSVSGNTVIRIESADGVVKDLPLIIDSRKFISETIPLDEENTALRIKPDPQKTAESEQLWAILSRTGKDIFSSDTFIAPVSSTRRTSFYGDRRTYNYIDNTSDTTIHAGIDYGVPTGTPVIACAAGRVVLAQSRIVTGNSVVLEHMPGVYTL